MKAISFRATLALAALLAGSPAAGAAQATGGAARRPAPDTQVVDSAAATPSPSLVPAGAPVVLGEDTVLVISARLGPYSPGERADAVARRLATIASERNRADTLVVPLESDGATDLMLGDRVLMTVSDADAEAAGVPRAALAARWATGLQAALAARIEAFSIKALVLGGLYSLLATVALALVLRIFARVFPRFYRLIGLWRTTRLRSIRFQKLELVSADRIGDALIIAGRVLRFAATLILLYFYFPLVFSFFPWTRSLSSELVGYVLVPLANGAGAMAGYLPNLLSIGLIVLATFYLLKLVKLVFDGVARGTITFEGFYPDWAEPTYKIIRFLILAFALILVWPYLPKSSSEGFRGVAAFLGLLLTFGSASAIGNIVGGVVMIYMRPFQVGDRVKIADTVGDVVAKNLLVTRVRTIKNVDVTVPNSMVLGSHIINYSSTAREGGLILHTTVTIGYDAPWRDVQAALLQAADRTEFILKSPAPFVLQTALNDFYVTYELNAYTDVPNRMAATYSDLHTHIQDAFNQAGLEIMSPHYEALRDGNRPAMPDAALGPDYEAPSFRVRPADSPR